MDFPQTLDLFKQKVKWSDLDSTALENLIELALFEDTAQNRKYAILGDLTTRACGTLQAGKLHIVAREKMIICGLGIIKLVNEIFLGKELELLDIAPSCLELLLRVARNCWDCWDCRDMAESCWHSLVFADG